MTLPTQPASWRKSSKSANTSTCVEVGRVADGAAVRDTKDRAAKHLTADHRQWQAFVTAVKADRFA